jgi:hypothetical protein
MARREGAQPKTAPPLATAEPIDPAGWKSQARTPGEEDDRVAEDCLPTEENRWEAAELRPREENRRDFEQELPLR